MAVNDTPSINEKSWQTTLPNNYGNGTVIENAVKVDNSYVSYVSLKTGTDRMIAWVMKNGTTRISDLCKPVKGGNYFALSYNVSSGADKGTRIMIRACSDTITSKIAQAWWIFTKNHFS